MCNAISICFVADTLKNNSLEEVSAEFILTDKVDTSQLSAQEAVIKSAKLGKNGRLGKKKYDIVRLRSIDRP